MIYYDCAEILLKKTPNATISEKKKARAGMGPPPGQQKEVIGLNNTYTYPLHFYCSTLKNENQHLCDGEYDDYTIGPQIEDTIDPRRPSEAELREVLLG